MTLNDWRLQQDFLHFDKHLEEAMLWELACRGVAIVHHDLVAGRVRFNVFRPCTLDNESPAFTSHRIGSPSNEQSVE